MAKTTVSDERVGWQDVAVLLGSIVLGALDFLLLGVAVAFGPAGFGGDGLVTSHELTVANLGQTAGWVGCVLAVVALLVFFALRLARTRRRTLVIVLSIQLVATTALAASMTSA